MEKGFTQAWNLATDFIGFMLGLVLPFLLMLLACAVIVGVVAGMYEAICNYHATKSKKK